MTAILSQIISLVAVLVLFSLTIVVHEWGHFIVARACGLVAEVFSLGFGPAIWRRRWRGVTWRIGLIPFGGYVTLPQIDPAGMEAVQEQGAPSHTESHRRPLPPATPWQRIVVSLAGAAGNLLLAYGLAWIVFLADRPLPTGQEGTVVGSVESGSTAWEAGLRPGDQIEEADGKPVRTWPALHQILALREEVRLTLRHADGRRETVVVRTAPDDRFEGMRSLPGVTEGTLCKVGTVAPGSPAAQAGLKPGDIIRFLDGEPVGGWGEMLERLQSREGRPTEIRFERNGSLQTVVVVPYRDPTLNVVRIGIRFDSLVLTPFAQIRQDAAGILRFLRSLLTPRETRRAARGVGGAISIVAAFWLHVQAGLLMALSFTRFLNVNLAILNLLPLPVLDGGHLVLALGEWITGRRPREAVLRAIFNLFFVLLVGLMLLLVFRDVQVWSRLRRQWRESASPATAPAEGAGEDGKGTAIP